MAFKNIHKTSDFSKGFRVKIYPTEDQKREINKILHVTRSVYNLGLEIQIKNYKNGGKYITLFELNKLFTQLTHGDEYPWLKSIKSTFIREELRRIDDAFNKFFKKINRFPKFKSRKRCKKSFGCRSDRTYIRGEYIQISGITGLVLAKDHHIPNDVRLWQTTVSTDGYDNYWFSCKICIDPIDMSDIPKSEAIGVDVGIVNMITTSDGDIFKFSDTSKLEKRKKRIDRRLSKDYQKYYQQSLDTRTKYEDIPKSKNHKKRQALAHKIGSKIFNKRKTEINTATKRIVDKNPSAIVIENISVKKMLKEDASWIRQYAPVMMFYEMHRQIKYKAELRGIPVIVAPEKYPSSQICNNCGCKGYFKHRQFICSNCGYTENRDINAAKNLRDLAYQNY